jgi:hypothetical protein
MKYHILFYIFILILMAAEFSNSNNHLYSDASTKSDAADIIRPLSELPSRSVKPYRP